jgi:hypothetical protein
VIAVPLFVGPVNAADMRRASMISISRRSVVGAAGAAWVLSALPGRVFAQSAAPDQAKRDFIKAANEQWKAEYAAAEARRKEREKRGEFASTQPPIELMPFKDWDFYYCKGRGPNWIPNKGQEKYKSVLVPKGFVTDLASSISSFADPRCWKRA